MVGGTAFIKEDLLVYEDVLDRCCIFQSYHRFWDDDVDLGNRAVLGFHHCQFTDVG